MMIGGSAKHVKNAVAPAIRNGSLRLSRLKEAFNRFHSVLICQIEVFLFKLTRFSPD